MVTIYAYVNETLANKQNLLMFLLIFYSSVDNVLKEAFANQVSIS